MYYNIGVWQYFVEFGWFDSLFQNFVRIEWINLNDVR